MASYTVVKGDTLGGIAKTNGMTLEELLELNPQYKDNPNQVAIGAVIQTDPTVAAEPGTVPATDFTDEETTRFNGLPGKPEIWRNKDNGALYAVYFPSGDKGSPIPLRYIINSEEVLKTYFGNKPVAYDHEYTNAEMDALGAVTFGDISEIDKTTGDPWAGFTKNMELAAEAMPWLADPGIFAVFASAYLKDEVPENWQFVGTEWWDSHNDAERAWLTKVAQDPASALQDVQDAEAKVTQAFLSLGVEIPSDTVIDYISQQWVQGTWSLQERNDQMAALTGGGEGVTLDPGLADITEGTEPLADATTYVDRVRALWAEWLGPAYPPTDAEIAKWSGILRDSGEGGLGGTARLTEMLRSQRLALFPEYEDPNLTWNDISGPWKSMAYNSWGVQVDESDPFLQELVRLNDANEAQKLLRGKGFERGYDRVVNQMTEGVRTGMGQNVRGVV